MMIQIWWNAKLPGFGICEHTLQVVELNTGCWMLPMKLTTTGMTIFLHP